ISPSPSPSFPCPPARLIPVSMPSCQGSRVGSHRSMACLSASAGVSRARTAPSKPLGSQGGKAKRGAERVGKQGSEAAERRGERDGAQYLAFGGRRIPEPPRIELVEQTRDA